ncbi:MAG: hypothetical protein II596_07080, partial [Thermoguttaceae bacterium]|nr:hypothetical protein [Thermoguttaceae bacterium]
MADTDDKSDVDDFFTTDENTEQTGDMSDVFSSADGSPLDVAPSSEISTDPFALDSGSIEISDPVSASAGVADDAQGGPQEEDKKSGKKGKKAKKEKAPKAKKEKAPKEPKAPKVKGEIVDKGAARAVRLLGLLLIIGIAIANVVAFITAGASCVTFLILFDILGLIALLVPSFLLRRLHSEPLSLFDTFLALAAIFSVVSCMAIL